MEIFKGKRSELEVKAAVTIKRSFLRLLKKHPTITFGIVGGRSVSGIFDILKTKANDISWSNIHIFFIDERLVSIDHPESNYRLAYDSFFKYLLDNKLIPIENIHKFNISENISKDLLDYEQELKRFSTHFDLVLLSTGENCHVACLHPDHETILSNEQYFISTDSSPKPPKSRMTSTKSLLERSSVSLLLFFGEEKRKAFKMFNNELIDVTKCPAKLVKNIRESYVFSDIL